MYKLLIKSMAFGIFAMSLLLYAVTGFTEEVRTDASGQWSYVLEDDGAKIVSYFNDDYVEDLIIPAELDGHMVTSIGQEAFRGHRSLVGVTIPSGVRNIEKNPFASFYCSLSYIHVSSSNLYYQGIDGVLFDKQNNELVAYPSGKEGTYAIPEGISNIGDEAFWGCTALTGIIIPDSVVRIGNYSFIYSGLEELIIPTGVITIGDWAFNESSLTRVTLPNSVASIGEYAFSHCYGLSSVIIPGSVVTIGKNAFAACDELTLFVEQGSTVEQYAKENNIQYMPMLGK